MEEQRYWLGLGTNVGDRGQALQRAVEWLGGRLAIEDVAPIYETAPRDVKDQPAFLNSAARVRTDLEPPAVLDLAKELEHDLGRVRRRRFGPREIDCDLLLWDGGTWDEERLTIPHPRLAERRFALLPVLDLNPEITLPDGTALADLERALDPGEQPARQTVEALAIPPVD